VWSHLRDYRERLNTVQREELADYFLPEMPARFLERHVPTRAVHLARRQRRKAKTDGLTPIVHVLVALIERRKAAMHCLLTRYREVHDQIEVGTCEAPVTFEYDDVVADVNRDAARVEQVHWIERPVRLRFTVWTPVAWMVAHGRAVYLRHHVGHTRTYHVPPPRLDAIALRRKQKRPSRRQGTKGCSTNWRHSPGSKTRLPRSAVTQLT
jgi:hypothetical protein